MIFALLVATTTCVATWFLTGAAQKRALGAFFGLVDAILWLMAGISAGKISVVIVAAFCAFCFARPFLRAHVYARLRREHAH
jgi:predicted Co/Zn/Cd cation transporter (cation efflux family)